MDSTVTDSNKPSGAASESFRSLTHFGGFDWAMDKHQFAVLDRDGTMLLNLQFTNDAQGWAELAAKMAAFAHLGVAIETRCGPAVERLLEMGLIVYPMNPKGATRFRDRKSPAGVKNDSLDAWCFARDSTLGCRHIKADAGDSFRLKYQHDARRPTRAICVLESINHDSLTWYRGP